MKKIISFAHVSLDGFIAGPEGEMDWIKIDQEIFDHVGKRIHKGDTALYGKTTFQMMEAYWPTAADKPDASKHDIEHAGWYKQVRKVVLSNTLKEADYSNTTVINGNLAERLQDIRKSGNDEDILVFGSPQATHSLMEANLIDGYWLFVNPIVLGEGIPLFKNIQEKTKLNLISTHVFKCGVTELSYVKE